MGNVKSMRMGNNVGISKRRKNKTLKIIIHHRERRERRGFLPKNGRT
jgi:hypothetical protein